MFMPGLHSQKHAVAEGLGIGIVPRAVVASRGTGGSLLAVPSSAARGTRALTLIYRDRERTDDGCRPFHRGITHVDDDTSARKTPASMRASR